MKQTTRGRIATAVILTAALAFGAIGCSPKKEPLIDEMACKRQVDRNSLRLHTILEIQTGSWSRTRQQEFQNAMRLCAEDPAFRRDMTDQYKEAANKEPKTRTQQPDEGHRVGGI